MTMNKIYRTLRNLAMLSLPLALGAVMSSCESGDQDFPDYGTITVYFANQGYVRTIELGDDPEIDLTNDNNHEFSINAAMGGGYGNKHDITVNYTVDASLIQGKTFEDGSDMVLLPENYYQLESSTITIPSGKIQGGVKVQLTDAFFADPLSKTRHYVLPVSITGVQGADSILASKKYVICAVKYVNPWQANYLRRGVDVITNAAGKQTTNTRHATYVEKDELVKIGTYGLNTSTFSVSMTDDNGKSYACKLLLTFNNDECKISSLTDGFTAEGNGSFVLKGEKKSFGGKDRNALYLKYSVHSDALGKTIATTDTLVMRDRGIAPEYFTPKIK